MMVARGIQAGQRACACQNRAVAATVKVNRAARSLMTACAGAGGTMVW